MLFPSERQGPKKWAFIDKEGKMVITPQFDDAAEFREGLASVGIGGKYGYIDKKGRFVVNPQFASSMPFDGGIAPVTINETPEDISINAQYKWGYIDTTGKIRSRCHCPVSNTRSDSGRVNRNERIWAVCHI